uniref:Uncharacterized protein n=1 Tax=Chaetoceros debilis TaxID=122233 RepID=A0A6S8ZE61_9STRA
MHTMVGIFIRFDSFVRLFQPIHLFHRPRLTPNEGINQVINGSIDGSIDVCTVCPPCHTIQVEIPSTSCTAFDLTKSFSISIRYMHAYSFHLDNMVRYGTV